MLHGYFRKAETRHYGQQISLKAYAGNVEHRVRCAMNGDMDHITILQVGNGEQQIILPIRGHDYQLCCRGVSAALDHFALELLYAHNEKSRLHLKTIQAFLTDAVDHSPAQNHFDNIPLSRDQLFQRDTLFILDRIQVGFSYQGAAIELYGKERVDAEWPDRGGALRARIRRLVYAGRGLLAQSCHKSTG